ncbi:ribosomal RNA small subunit methyltransferase A [Patescibacteria group bacterium]|nr:ribosomal RNA small subunit methyltransferase A [Patescibacteria group bacterium]
MDVARDVACPKNLMSQIPIGKIIKKYKIRPSKGLGQNFLVDKGVLQKIVATAELKPDDIVLEIGPGIGNLTQELAKRVKKVIAIEKDIKMVEILKNVLDEQGIQNVEIINGDILKIQNSKFKIQNSYKVVANLPYYITSPVIRLFLEKVEVKPQQMVLMVQKEVAQRIVAQPPDMNLLAVSVQFYAKPEIISYVSKRAFWPSPKVDSAIIKIIPRQFGKKATIVGNLPRELFFKVVRAGFSHPRKQLLNNLASGLKLDKEKMKEWLLKNNIQPSQRAETLSVEDWLNLAKCFKMK